NVFARSGPFRGPRGHDAGRKEHDDGGSTARPTRRRLRLAAPGNGDRILNWRARRFQRAPNGAISPATRTALAPPKTPFPAVPPAALRNAVKSSKFNRLLAFTLPCRIPIFVSHQTA